MRKIKGTESLFSFLLCLAVLLSGCGRSSEKAGEAKVFGRIFTERCDDLAWENDLVGFRAYGPATQANGERVYGYDIFFKYPDKGLVLEQLYAPETDRATWARVDSLKKIDPALADEYIASFSYHIDHGLGMDCYPVGPTLGAGVCALIDSTGEIVYPLCYSEAEIRENGPERFEVHLTFEPRKISGMDSVVEHRIISLEAGSHLNKTRVWYDNLTDTAQFLIGVPRRDDSPAIIEPEKRYVAYADPTDLRPGNTAILGIIYDVPMEKYGEFYGHIGAAGTIHPGDTVYYRWGFTWPGSDIKDMKGWTEYLDIQTKI